MKKHKKIIIIAIILVLIALALVGYINFGGKPEQDTSEQPTVSEIDSTKTASQVLASQDTFSKFSQALTTNMQATDIEGQVTIFAPNNQAFNDLPQSTLITETLDKKISGYHIAKGLYLSSELTDGQKIPTLSGIDLVVLKKQNEIYILDSKGNKVKILSPDLKTKDGYIHEVSHVFIPQ